MLSALLNKTFPSFIHSFIHLSICLFILLILCSDTLSKKVPKPEDIGSGDLTKEEEEDDDEYNENSDDDVADDDDEEGMDDDDEEEDNVTVEEKDSILNTSSENVATEKEEEPKMEPKMEPQMAESVMADETHLNNDSRENNVDIIENELSKLHIPFIDGEIDNVESKTQVESVETT